MNLRNETSRGADLQSASAWQVKNLPHGLAILLAVFASSVVLAQDKPPQSQPSTQSKKDVTAAPSAKTWTCSMHPQVRWPKEGKCPICSMDFIPFSAKLKHDHELPTLPSLQEMLSIGLKHNANIRAAEARVKAAEADRDRTRFDVLQEIIAFRAKWDAEHVGVQAALTELREAEKSLKSLDNARNRALAENAHQKYELTRAKLAEVSAQLPFLLGRAPGDKVADAEPGDASRKLIKQKLLPQAQQTLQVLTKAYNVGEAEVTDLMIWWRRIVELELRLADTKEQRTKLIEDHKTLLDQIAKIANTKYRAGQTSQADVLAVHYQIAETELWLADLPDD